MEEVPSDVEVHVKEVSSKGIIMRDREEITEKGEEIKTTEYFLDVGDQVEGDEVEEAQFVTVQTDHDTQFVAVEVNDSGQLILPEKEVILWNEICRVCANTGSDKEFIPIFSGEGVEHELSNKIHTYLPVRVSENDTLPLQVCYNCAATLVAWDEIFRSCVDAQQRLVELQSKLNLKEQYYNDSTVEEENMETVLEVETANQEQPQVESKEIETLETLQIVESNRRTDSKKKRDPSTKAKTKGPLSSLSPAKEFPRLDPVEKEQRKSMTAAKSEKPETSLCPVKPLIKPVKSIDLLKTAEKKKIKPSIKAKTKESRGSLRTSEQIIESVDRLKFNESSKPDEPTKQDDQSSETYVYVCGVCEKVFDDESELMRHMRDVHEENQSELDSVRYECSICNRSYAFKLRLIKHLASHKNTAHLPGEGKAGSDSKVQKVRTIYQCDMCKKVLSTRKTLLRHIRVHNDERPIICEECGKAYRVDEDLKRHQDDVHRKIKRYACDLCGKCFAAKGTRDAHRRIHTGEKPFECKECGKFFRSINLLGIHKKIHSDYRPHQCNFCEKAFRSKQKLEAHDAIHTGIRPYPCDVCGRMFAAKGEATRHRSVHFSDRPFLCSECGLAFRLNRYLKTHIKTHHKDKVESLLRSLTK